MVAVEVAVVIMGRSTCNIRACTSHTCLIHDVDIYGRVFTNITISSRYLLSMGTVTYPNCDRGERGGGVTDYTCSVMEFPPVVATDY